jgi:hypothetical protein
MADAKEYDQNEVPSPSEVFVRPNPLEDEERRIWGGVR